MKETIRNDRDGKKDKGNKGRKQAWRGRGRERHIKREKWGTIRIKDEDCVCLKERDKTKLTTEMEISIRFFKSLESSSALTMW